MKKTMSSTASGGLPLHELTLKRGIFAMVIRNLNGKQGSTLSLKAKRRQLPSQQSSKAEASDVTIYKCYIGYIQRN